jgi:hypothetical protein
MTLQDVEIDKELYQEAYAFLLKFEGVTMKLIEAQLLPEPKRTKPDGLNLIYEAILESAQNLQMSPNVIGKSISGEKGVIGPLREILFEFDPKKTQAKYGACSAEELFGEIRPRLIQPPRDGKNSLWLRYCKTIISASAFLSQFQNHHEFYKFIDTYYDDDKIRPFLPMLLSFEIDGLGFALSCDVLKEMGYVKFGKPDTHTKDILIQLGLLGAVPKTSSKADYFSLRLLERIAKSNDTTVYAVDKLLWLIGSGDFYLGKLKIGSKKKEFIEFMKRKKHNQTIQPTRYTRR